MQVEKLVIVEQKGRTFTRDEMTGEILEYPFEEMDPYQAIDRYMNGDGSKMILEITTNKSNVLTSEEIFKDFVLNLED